MTNRYVRLVREPKVARVLLPYLVGRLPGSMVLLALLLMVRASERSFGRAGLVSAAYGVGAAVSAPILGRIADRRGQTRVMVVCGLGYAVALGWTVFASANLSFGAVVTGATLAGIAAPPTGACMRALWPQLVSDDELLETSYALDGMLIEASELAGPLMVAGLAMLGGPSLAVIVAAAMTSGGALLFAAARPSRQMVRSARGFHWAGPLRRRGVLALLAVIFVSTAGIGCFEVAVVGFATRHGGSAGAGVLLACVTAGSILGGLWYGSRTWRAPLTHQLALLLAVVAALSLLPLLAPNQLVMGLLLVVTGVAVAPSLVVQLSLMSRITTAESRTEAFTWGSTANFAGIAIGGAFAGWVLERFSVTGAFAAAAGTALLAVAVAAAAHRSLTPAEAADAAATADGLAVEIVEVFEGAEPAVAVAPVLPLRSVDLRLPLVVAGGDERARLLRVLRRAEELALAADQAANDVRLRAEADAAATVAEAEREAQAVLMRAEIQALRLVASAEERAGEIVANARGDARAARPAGPSGEPEAQVYPFPGTGS
jgi:predicted MFS family arabinose efflux permease